MDQIFDLHGIPSSIVSNHDVTYFGWEWKENINRFWLNVIPTSSIGVKWHSFQDCLNHFPSLHGFGHIFRWISLNGSLNMEGRQWSWLWLITSPNIVIFSLIHPYTTSLVAQIFMDKIFCLHGIPSSIVSNRDANFTSHIWKEIFFHTSTKLKMSSGYHPKTSS